MSPKSLVIKDSLADVYDEYQEDPRFDHLRTANFVPGSGNPYQPQIMFIGEAPGAKEDATGEPFVGAAGQVLDDILAVLGLTRRKVFITNVVKYRPPNNRTPTPDEIATAKPYLNREVRLIRPHVIVPLGRVALTLVSSKASISHIHGRVFRRNGWLFLPMYHPAAVLYDRSKHEVMMQDCKQLRRLIKPCD